MKPFLKWAGGKRWLRSTIANLTPPDDHRYIEPFLGSGAIFFDRHPKLALLSDSNERLIETYIAIRDNPVLVRKYLDDHSRRHSETHYYIIRSSRYGSAHQRAAQFIYLNRSCWNGLYRVNKKGEFNVPKGTKDAIILPDDDFESVRSLLKSADIRCEDFETAVDRATSGDLIYCDPPYTVHHNMNGFLKYNETIFSWDDQIRLKLSLERAVNRGARILISNACHSSIISLYEDFGELITLDRASVIAGGQKGRGRYAEVLIRAGW